MESPGKSLNLQVQIARPEKSWAKAMVLESCGKVLKKIGVVVVEFVTD